MNVMSIDWKCECKEIYIIMYARLSNRCCMHAVLEYFVSCVLDYRCSNVQSKPTV